MDLRRSAHAGFGHRRLSIIDLSRRGRAADGERRRQARRHLQRRDLQLPRAARRLEAKGRVFRSQSDTEVLLHLYAEKGEAMVHDLRGMFAFAIWDAERRQLFLARDPYGIKPLYYADDGWTFRFASQVKALLAGGAMSRDPDPAGHVGLLPVRQRARAVHDLSRDPRACRRAHAHGRSDRRCTRRARYHSIAAVYRRQAQAATAASASMRLQAESATARARQRAQPSGRRRAGRRVPVGRHRLRRARRPDARCGRSRTSRRSRSPSRNSAASTQDEAPLAAEVARALWHAAYDAHRHPQREFEADLPRILEAMDQPSIDGINTWFVSKAAHELGLKVAISGLGGDELFGGYPSFRDIPRWVTACCAALARPAARQAVRMMAARAADRRAWAGNPEVGRHARVRRQLRRRLSVAARAVHAVGARRRARSRHRRAGPAPARAAAA